MLGDSAYAVPHYQKLYARVPHVWGNRRGQPNRSAMERPRPGGAALLITATPAPGKYACDCFKFEPVTKAIFAIYGVTSYSAILLYKNGYKTSCTSLFYEINLLKL